MTDRTMKFSPEDYGEEAWAKAVQLKVGAQIYMFGEPVIITENSLLANGTISYRSAKAQPNIIVDEVLNELRRTSS